MNSKTTATTLIPEWAEQSAVLIAWPQTQGDFQPWLKDVENCYVNIAKNIAQQQRLIIACQNKSHQDSIEARLNRESIDSTRIKYAPIPYNDVWVRDTAPLTVSSIKGIRFLDFRFNGWGGKYDHQADAELARNLYESGAIGCSPLDKINFVLEGGSIETDGAGTIMTTTRCLLNPNRNPEFNQGQIEGMLLQHLGADKVLWLGHGYAEGDDTDSHIDTLARFCSGEIIAYTACDNTSDPLYEEFLAMEEQIRGFTSASGSAYRLVRLPIPDPIYSEDGNRLPATYANFLIINGAVLVPTYDDPNDTVALERLADCFPDRTMIPIDCRALIRQYGSLHCMTMQFPLQ